MVQSKCVHCLLLHHPSHRRRCSFRGPTATAFLEWLTPSSLYALAPYTSTLSVLLNERGGIIDDTVITKHAEDAFYVVTNAGRRERDLAWFRDRLDEWNAGELARERGKVEHEVLEDWGLLALQGACPPARPLRVCVDLNVLLMSVRARPGGGAVFAGIDVV